MRLELLRKAVVMPVTYQEYLDDPEAFGPMQRRVSRLRSALWRGRSWQALLQFAWLRKDIDRWAAAIMKEKRQRMSATSARNFSRPLDKSAIIEFC
jgi:hypothetical protein